MAIKNARRAASDKRKRNKEEEMIVSSFNYETGEYKSVERGSRKCKYTVNGSFVEIDFILHGEKTWIRMLKEDLSKAIALSHGKSFDAYEEHDEAI